jgi:hypothetical protein
MADYTQAPLAQDTQDANLKAIQSTFAPKYDYNPLVETVRAAGQGATFGTLDEIEAALRTGSITNAEYIKLRDQLRGQQKQFGQEMPIIKTGVEVGGAFLTPYGAAKYLPEVFPAISSAQNLGTQILQTAKYGALTGGLAGAGYAEKDTGMEAAKGAVFGGVLGSGIPIVINKAGSLIKNVLSSAGIGDQTTASSKLLANYLEKDNLTAEEAQMALDELRKLRVPQPVIADLGNNLRSLAYNAYVVQSKAKNATESFLENRLIDQPNNIVKGLVEKAGLAKNVNGYEYLDGLAQNQAQKASLAYPRAYSMDISTQPFRTYVDRPIFIKAYEEAQKRAAVYGETLPPLDSIRNAQSVPTDILHKIKIGLDRVIDAETDAVTSKVTGYGRDVIKVKNEFNDKIKSLNDDYRLANEQFADAARIKNSFEMGQKYQRLDPKEAASKIKKMNSDEKEAFRLGMMADINSRVGNFKGGDFTRQIFKSDNQKLLMRYAFDDQNAYNEFSQYVKALENQSKTSKKIIGGSPSGERISSAEQARELGGLAQSAATGDMFGLAKQAGASLLSRAKGISSESSELLQQRLFATDPIEQRLILSELNRRAKAKPVGLLTGAAGVGTTTGMVGN